MNCTDVHKLRSHELINLLADLGYGKHFSKDDTRTASCVETGTFTSTGKKYAKIVVKVHDCTMYDYGVRIMLVN